MGVVFTACVHVYSYRSPGGTVKGCRRRNREVGEGPTPMLTRALRKKFQVSLIIQISLFLKSIIVYMCDCRNT